MGRTLSMAIAMVLWAYQSMGAPDIFAGWQIGGMETVHASRAPALDQAQGWMLQPGLKEYLMLFGKSNKQTK